MAIVERLRAMQAALASDRKYASSVAAEAADTITTLRAQLAEARNEALALAREVKIAELSPVRRLGKSHANDETYGSHMVDIVDTANGHVLARCVYERYADEIISAVAAIRKIKAHTP